MSYSHYGISKMHAFSQSGCIVANLITEIQLQVSHQCSSWL